MRYTMGMTLAFLLLALPIDLSAAAIDGVVRDETGGVLPGVTVLLLDGDRLVSESVTGPNGEYRVEGIAQGRYRLRMWLVNFGATEREMTLDEGAVVRADAVMHLTLSADVTVTGRSTFVNLADLDRPAEDVVGIAQSASQGAITARQLEARPMMRAGDVLETVPGLIVSQHSGEGKANQYYLRGFNLDHGTDFATTVAGMPVNMPTHGHGHGYSDPNFLIPELVTGVQFSKGPYFPEQGDFATAGSASMTYGNFLTEPLVQVQGGGQGFRRVLAAASPKVGRGYLLTAIELGHNNGPWILPERYRKTNGLIRYTQGDALNGFSLTGMGYRSRWNSTDQIPARAVGEGIIGRFGFLDGTDGGDTHRYSGSFEWQRTGGNATTKVTAYGIGYGLSLFSNFTFFLDDPEHGDQFHQADHRFVSGAKVSHRRMERWGGRAVLNTLGLQVRNDDIGHVSLSHTKARQLISPIRHDSVLQTSAGLYAQSEVQWAPRVRTLAGVRADGFRFNVDAGEPGNGGTARAGLLSPKGGVAIGPFGGTEFYVNGGYGFHSNDARGTTMTVDSATGAAVERVTPLVRAKGAELGVRTVAIPRLQTSVALWSLSLASELVFVGDAGTTQSGRPSHRYGVEWQNYYRPLAWLMLDGDISLSRARFTDADTAGDRIPGSVGAVFSAGIAVDSIRSVFGGLRMRYFGPRALAEDDSVRSNATSLVNAELGYKISQKLRIGVDVFNLFNAAHSDIDYFYSSRLPGEPAEGVDDIHFHPTLPRTARVSLTLSM